MAVLEYTVRTDSGVSAGTGPYFNIFHVNTIDTTSTRVDLIRSKLGTFFTSSQPIYCTDTSQIIPTKVLRVDVDPPQYVASAQQSPTGTGGTSHAPAQICMVVSWRTATATRSGRGRTYLGPLSLGAVETTGALKTTSCATVSTAATTLIAALAAIAADCYLVVWRRPVKDKVTHFVTPGAATQITSASVSTNPYTQRRRAS